MWSKYAAVLSLAHLLELLNERAHLSKQRVKVGTQYFGRFLAFLNRGALISKKPAEKSNWVGAVLQQVGEWRRALHDQSSSISLRSSSRLSSWLLPPALASTLESLGWL